MKTVHNIKRSCGHFTYKDATLEVTDEVYEWLLHIPCESCRMKSDYKPSPRQQEVRRSAHISMGRVLPEESYK